MWVPTHRPHSLLRAIDWTEQGRMLCCLLERPAMWPLDHPELVSSSRWRRRHDEPMIGLASPFLERDFRRPAVRNSRDESISFRGVPSGCDVSLAKPPAETDYSRDRRGKLGDD